MHFPLGEPRTQQSSCLRVTDGPTETRGTQQFSSVVPPHSAPVCKKSEEQGGRDKGRTRADSSPKFPPLMKGGMCAKRLGEARGSSGG